MNEGDQGTGQKTGAQSLESSLKELEDIVLALEDGDLSLEESLKVFERGVCLVGRCNSLLEGAEQRIEVLTGDRPEELH